MIDFMSQVWDLLSDPTYWSGPTGIPTRVFEHVRLSALAVAVAGAAALPVGLFIGHYRRLTFVAVSAANLGRALPSLAIIALLLPFSIRLGLGLGFWPTVGAMVLLGIPPIITNTYVGIQAADPDSVDAARGMGMKERQILARVELPLAAPLIVAGFRTAAVQVVATATLGALVAWGGLGRFIIDGFAVGNRPLIFTGGLLVALLAVATELMFSTVERLVTPKTGRSGPARLPETTARPAAV